MKKGFLSKSILLLAVTAVMFFAMTVTAFADQVEDLTQTNDSETSVTVSWTAPVGYTYFDVYYATSKDGTYAQYPTTLTNYNTSLSYFTLSSLGAGKSYYIYIVPVEKTWDSSTYSYVYTEMTELKSDVFEAVTAPNTAVTNLKQSYASTKAVKLSWTASTGATGYYIRTSYSGSNVTKTTKTAVKLSLSAGSYQTYYVVPYRVSESGYVAEGTYAYNKVTAYSAPNKPTNVASASDGNVSWNPSTNKVTVGWDKNSNNSYTPDGYQLVVYDVKGKTKLKTYTIKSGSTYTYKFKIASIKNKGCRVAMRSYVKINGKKYYSSWTSKTVVLPQAKITAATQKNATTVKISWKKVTGATKYIIYYKKGYSGTWKSKKVSAKKTAYTFKKLSTGNDYYFYVMPVVKVGSKKYTAKLSTVTTTNKFTWTSSALWN